MIHKTISVFTYQKISIFFHFNRSITCKCKMKQTIDFWGLIFPTKGYRSIHSVVFIQIYLKNTHSLACFKKHAIETLFVIYLMKMTDIWVNLSIFINRMFMREVRKGQISQLKTLDEKEYVKMKIEIKCENP